jgi:MSHA biogenesis protein MshI
LKLLIPALLGRPRPTSWTAFDLSGGLIVASVSPGSKNGDKPKVLRHSSVIGKDPDSFALAELDKAGSATSCEKALILNRGEYQIFQADKPAVKAEEINKSLEWALSSLIDYPVTEANLAWLDIPSEGQAAKQAKVYLVCSKREIVDYYDQLFKKANANLAAADVRETSQRNIAALMKTGGHGVCLVFAEKAGVQITITLGDELYLERFIREPVYPESAGTLPDPEQMDRIALEIQRSIDFVRRAFPSIPLEEVTVGPTLQNIQLTEQLSQRMTEPVRSLDLSTLFDWPENSNLHRPEIQALYFYALGGALRGRRSI